MTEEATNYATKKRIDPDEKPAHVEMIACQSAAFGAECGFAGADYRFIRR
jgi:hypothetical protein